MHPLTATTELFAGYRDGEGAFDEMVDERGQRRPHWDRLATSLDRLGRDDLARSRAEARRLLDADGVTYYPGEVHPGAVGADEWRLDALPVVVSGDEWAALDRAIVQRARLLDLLLADLYGPRQLLGRGVLPPEVVFGHPGFLRECDGVRLPGAHQLFLTATDIARDRDGARVALSDRTQAPSGAGYALENRTVISRVFPGIYRDNEVQRLAPFFRQLRTSLRDVAPPTDGPPRVVVLTPGPRSETAFEHALLAAHLGYPLVKGTDLRVRDGRVWMHTLGRLDPVHVILRRVDSDFCDPLELQPDSHLGVPGLVEACRLGSVSVVNTLGSGVLENPALLPFLPAVAAELLGEPLRLPSVATWWCGEPSSLSHVLANLEHLVLKPVARGPASATVIGSQLDRAALDALRRAITARPRQWVGQESVAVGTVPALVGDVVEPRRAILRAFAVAAGDSYQVMPGGLTRVATDTDGGLITSQTGASSKDTWVLSDEPEQLSGFWLQPGPMLDAVVPESSMSSRAAENLFWLGRYAERAETMVRMVRVTSDRRNELASGTVPAGDACLDILLPALSQVSGTLPGFVGAAGAAHRHTPGDELRSLVCDLDRTGSLAFDVAHMLEAASEVRDQLSPDTWLVIGHLDRDLAGLDRRFGSSAAQAALGRVMQGLLALAGLSAESMVRDPGWQFMEIGRRIERAIQLCQLLDATLVEVADLATDSLVLESTLTMAESIITYRRRSRGQAQIQTVLDLLILDTHNPRSLAYQLAVLNEHLSTLPGASTTDPSPAARRALAAQEAVATADTEVLSRADDQRRRARLRTFLATLIDHLTSTAAALDAEHFVYQLPQQTMFTPNDAGRR